MAGDKVTIALVGIHGRGNNGAVVRRATGRPDPGRMRRR